MSRFKKLSDTISAFCPGSTASTSASASVVARFPLWKRRLAIRLLAVGWLFGGVNLSPGATMNWSGADAFANVNANWFDINNWLGKTPAPGNRICFFDRQINNTHGVTFGNSLNLPNCTIRVGWAGFNVSGLNPCGVNNAVQVKALPPSIFYPANFMLILTDNGISGTNRVLNWPEASPANIRNLIHTNQAAELYLTGGTADEVNATVTFSPTNAGLPLNPAFVGLSYEKLTLTRNIFVSDNVPLVKLFSQIGPAVLRIGGGTVDTTCWGGVSNLTPITASEVDAFAGFVKALPTNWSVIYGINFSVNNPTNCAAEAAYVAKALGPRLLGFEIGNEPEAYPWNGIRSRNFTYSNFVSQWRPLAAAITNAVPGWAITNGGRGWTLTGPASGGNTNYTISFARDEAGVISLLTQHYYRASGTKPTSTMQLLLQPDPKLPGTVTKVASAATAANLPLGFREDECGSYSHGGVRGVSDAYGAALWSLDFMFTVALNGGQGINFHGGGRSPYTPIADNGMTVLQVRPEFYGLKMFSLLPHGNVVPATIALASNIDFTAYGVRQADRAVSALLNNKDTNNTVVVSVHLGPDVTTAQLIELTGPSLHSTNGYTLGGATINPNGSWNGGAQAVLSATNGLFTVYVPPISAVLLNPVVTGRHQVVSVRQPLNASSRTRTTGVVAGSPIRERTISRRPNLLRTPIRKTRRCPRDRMSALIVSWWIPRRHGQYP